MEFRANQESTLLSHSFVQAPQKVQRPFYPEGKQTCHVVLLHTAGGMVGGDRLSSQIRLQPRSHALLTTATAAKIYRSNGCQARQSIEISLGEQSCLEWLPQETILFRGARYRQDLQVNLAAGAVWMGWEVVRLGRSARGEAFDQGEWRSHTQIWQQGRLLWVDPQWVEGGSAMMTSLHGLNHCSVVGSFALVGRVVAPEGVEKARSLWNPADSNPAPAEVGVTRLSAGLLCRYRGHSTAEARRWFTEVWGLLRQEWLQRPLCKPRVW